MGNFVSNELKELEIHKLISYSDHPFQVYEGKKLDELTESIKEQGIISPLIARPHPANDGKFEVLAGHNRLAAAGKLNLTKVPVIVRYDLKGKDDEALLVVIETNLNQRSFKDLKFSERAKAIHMFHEALKRQNRRSDLTNQTEKALEEAEFRQVGERLNSDEETALNFNLSPRTVSRYLQIHRLSKPLLDRLDNNEFAFDPAINVSYLKEAEQKYLDGILADSSNNYKLTMKNAKALRKASANSIKALSKADIEEIIGKEASTKMKSVASSQDKASLTVKALMKLTKTVIPGIVSNYSGISNPTEEDNKRLIVALREAFETAMEELKV